MPKETNKIDNKSDEQFIIIENAIETNKKSWKPRWKPTSKTMMRK